MCCGGSKWWAGRKNTNRSNRKKTQKPEETAETAENEETAGTGGKTYSLDYCFSFGFCVFRFSAGSCGYHVPSMPTASSITATATGIVLKVKVVPGASRNRVMGLLGERWKLQVSAPPEGGRANEAVCKLLAQTLGVPARDVNVIDGYTRPQKTVAVCGVNVAEAENCLDGATR